MPGLSLFLAEKLKQDSDHPKAQSVPTLNMNSPTLKQKVDHRLNARRPKARFGPLLPVSRLRFPTSGSRTRRRCPAFSKNPHVGTVPPRPSAPSGTPYRGPIKLFYRWPFFLLDELFCSMPARLKQENDHLGPVV